MLLSVEPAIAQTARLCNILRRFIYVLQVEPQIKIAYNKWGLIMA